MAKYPDLDSVFLSQLGHQLRTMRARHAMSRQKLAELSGVSNRFIAQLERGVANISIIRLRRISNALDLNLQDLIPATRTGDKWSERKSASTTAEREQFSTTAR